MSELDAATPTLHTRVDAWECDFNGHWNTKYYCRSFQTAAEVAAALNGNGDPDSIVPSGRHLRFHSELGSGDPVVIRSFNVPAKGEAPRTAHFLTCYGKIAATALDIGLAGNPSLGDLPEALAARVMPRGITGPVTETWEPDPAVDVIVELGPVRGGETYADGTLRFENAVARLASASHHHAMEIGYTPQFTAGSGIGRMLVEMRYTLLGGAQPGTFLRGASRLVSVEGKSYTTAHLIYTHAGEPVAVYELCTLAVDMTTRRATSLPDFVAARTA